MFDKKDKGRWWDSGIQLIEGCTPVSVGCDNCWAMAKERRFRKENGIVFHYERLSRPYERKKPTAYAIWNDLFHDEISFQDALDVLFAAQKNPQHIFMILTKRPERMREFFIEWAPNPFFKPLPNIWLGVTAENQTMVEKRIPVLLQIPAAVRFLSCEPLIENIDVSWDAGTGMGFRDNYLRYGIDWVIAGPETGPGKRPYKKEWFENLYNQCKPIGIPFYDKKNVLGMGLYEIPTIGADNIHHK